MKWFKCSLCNDRNPDNILHREKNIFGEEIKVCPGCWIINPQFIRKEKEGNNE